MATNDASRASVIIPCWNQLEFTRQCVRALLRHTRPPWELIVVNNGSTDGTGDYLAGLQDASPVPVTVVANSINRGFPGAINQGLSEARGEYLVLMNNDVVVTDGWLDQLVALTGVRPERPQVEQLPARCPPPPAPPLQGGEICGSVSGREGMACVGLAGPMSNYAAPPQLVDDVPYHDMHEMHAFARTWRDEHRGKWFTVPKLSGFCLLIKRAVYDKIGGLDERFGLGFFDDDDLAERARRAGFELAVARDLFVHHFGSRTFVGNDVDAEGLLDENARRFAAKWGLAETRGRRVSLRPFGASTPTNGEVGHVPPTDLQSRLSLRESSPLVPTRPRGNTASGRSASLPIAPESANGETRSVEEDVPAQSLGTRNHNAPRSLFGLASPGSPALPLVNRARTSLTMIVRNEVSNLSACLRSAEGLFDEIIIVDTGSTDRTVEIARSFGARVFDFPWVDDFAAARNAALARATGDYAFWLDADDVIDAPERQKLEAHLHSLGAGEDAGYVIRCACDPSPDGTGGDTVVDHIRLFPLREGLRWTYRVHEQILPALRRFKIPVHWTDITVRHTGYVDQALRGRKLERDTRILRAELDERPDDPFVLFNLGAIAVERKDWTGALESLERSLAGSAPSDSIVRKLYALIARVHQMTGDSQAALRTCADGLSLDGEDAELWFRKAVVHRHRGESSDAEGCWRRILTLTRPNVFCSIDQGIYGHLTRRNLAALAAERGDVGEADKLWHAVLAECPGDREALAKLGSAT
jgi:glycosyltransferase involved in cell wall biosynthesis